MGRQREDPESRITTPIASPASNEGSSSSSSSASPSRHKEKPETGGVQVNLQSSSRTSGGMSASKRTSSRARNRSSRYVVEVSTKEPPQFDPPDPPASIASPHPLNSSPTCVAERGTPDPELSSEPFTSVKPRPNTSRPSSPPLPASSPFAPLEPPHVPSVPLSLSRTWSRSRTRVCDCPSPQNVSAPMSDGRSRSPPSTPFPLCCLRRRLPSSPNDFSAQKTAPSHRAPLSSLLHSLVPAFWTCLHSLSSPPSSASTRRTSPPRQLLSSAVPDATAPEAEAWLPVLPYSDPVLASAIVRVTGHDRLPASSSHSASPDAFAVFRFLTTGHRARPSSPPVDSHPPQSPHSAKQAPLQLTAASSPSPQRQPAPSSLASQSLPHHGIYAGLHGRPLPRPGTPIVIEDVPGASIKVSHLSEAYYAQSPRLSTTTPTTPSIAARDAGEEYVSGAAWVQSCMPVAVQHMTRAQLTRSCSEHAARASLPAPPSHTSGRALYGSRRRSSRPASPSITSTVQSKQKPPSAPSSSFAASDALAPASPPHASRSRSRLWVCSAALLPQCQQDEKDQRHTQVATRRERCGGSGTRCGRIGEPLTGCISAERKASMHSDAFVI